MNNSLCLGVVSQRIIRAVATAILLYGYRHIVVWLPPHSWMATAILRFFLQNVFVDMRVFIGFARLKKYKKINKM